jgi:hypothetical protein
MINDKISTIKEYPYVLSDFVTFSGKFHNYSIRNRLLIGLQNRGASFVSSYKDWQDKGYHVNKGEHI